MATQLQVRRGTTTENNNFTGAIGEITMDTTKNGLRIHDGATTGGFEIPVIIEKQLPNASNNYTWYRKYADGWVEQGGQTSDTTDGAIAITLPVELADANYIPMITGTYITNTGDASNNGASKAAGAFSDRTTTGFNLWKQSPVPYGWQVSGMAA